jgi:hypothetical protein
MTKKKKVNTSLARGLAASARRRKKAKAKPKKEEKKPKQAAAQKAQPHASSSAPAKAILDKDGTYAKNGHDYLKGQQGRGVYQNVSHPYFVHIKDLVADNCKFPGGPDQNFNPAFGQDYPYKYQAHHILPAGCFSAKTSAGPVFNNDQMKLLLQSEYNINNGHNIIMLPYHNEHVCVHVLLQHKGSHNQYTTMVMKGLKKVGDKLQKMVDEKKPHEEVTANLAKDLEQMETAYWNWIVKVSKSVVAKVAGQKDYEYDPIKFQTSSKSRLWGSLA